MFPHSPSKTTTMATTRVSPHNFTFNLPPQQHLSSSSVQPATHNNLPPTFSVPLDAPMPFPGKPRPTAEEYEIDVFPAEKYFNGNMDGPDPLRNHRLPFHHARDKDGKVLEFGPAIKSAETASIISESSANSRTSLLFANTPRPTSKTSTRGRQRRLIRILQCNCTESVQVRTLPKDKPRIHHTTGRAPATRGGISCRAIEEEEDARSEASSDLFEIESISTVTNPCFTKSRTDGTLSTSTCYAPSEASVAWSVVTASAALDAEGSEWGDEVPRRKAMPTVAMSRQQHHGGIFAGCTSLKAVSVSSSTMRLPERMGSDGERPTEPRDARLSMEERRAADLRIVRPGLQAAARGPHGQYVFVEQ